MRTTVTLSDETLQFVQQHTVCDVPALALRKFVEEYVFKLEMDEILENTPEEEIDEMVQAALVSGGFV